MFPIRRPVFSVAKFATCHLSQGVFEGLIMKLMTYWTWLGGCGGVERHGIYDTSVSGPRFIILASLQASLIGCRSLNISASVRLFWTGLETYSRRSSLRFERCILIPVLKNRCKFLSFTSKMSGFYAKDYPRKPSSATMRSPRLLNHFVSIEG